MTAAKSAVTVPRETLLAVEKRRSALGMSRSAVVTAALEAWLTDATMTAEERSYVLSYLRDPESIAERRDTSAVASAVAATWATWDEHAPSKSPRKKRKSR